MQLQKGDERTHVISQAEDQPHEVAEKTSENCPRLVPEMVMVRGKNGGV